MGGCGDPCWMTGDFFLWREVLRARGVLARKLVRVFGGHRFCFYETFFVAQGSTYVYDILVCRSSIELIDAGF